MLNRLTGVLDTWRYLWRHPLASRNRATAFANWFRWQLGSRLLPGGAIVPFVGGSSLVVRPGMAGATGNIYCGLHEFEDMAFALHLLRPGDLFVDAGANIGSYSVLAASAGASCVSVEPIAATSQALRANIRINGWEDRIRVQQVGLGAKPGVAQFTSELGAMNHVVSPGEPVRETVQVAVSTLDDLLRDERPTLLKVDVEGFENEVFLGGEATLSSPSLLAMIVELNGSAERYGADELALIEKFRQFGFQTYAYSPFQRSLVPLSGRRNNKSGNTLFVRDVEEVSRRIQSAPAWKILGTEV